MNDETRARIQAIIEEKPVVLFMKGTKTFPRCGFSATVVEVLRRSGVTDFKDVNVLEDPEIREGIKEFTNWPTIPQLYVNGKFVGGSDIVREKYENGELQPILEETEPKSA